MIYQSWGFCGKGLTYGRVPLAPGLPVYRGGWASPSQKVTRAGREKTQSRERQGYSVTADRIFYNGNIITVDAAFSIAEAVAIGNGRVLAVGSNQTCEQWKGAQTEMVDLEGKTMMPGIIDAHGHVGMVVKFANWADLKTPDFYTPFLYTVDQIVDILKKHKEDNHLDGEQFVLGFGYHESRLAERRFLDKFDLDRVSDTQPVIVSNISLHVFSFNSVALKMLNINENTSDPETSTIFRVPGSREPNGVIQGPLAQELIFNLDIDTMETKLAAFDKAQKLYFSTGITTAQEGKSTPTDMEIFDIAAKAGRTVLDIVSYADYHNIDASLEKYPFPVGEERDHIKVCGMKIISDGTLSSGAFLTRPFEGTADNYGIEYCTFEQMEGAIRKAIRNKWQFAVHAMGDAAIDKLLNVYEKVLKEEGADPNEFRNIIIHGSAMRLDQMDRIKKLHMVVSFYPSAGASLYELFCSTIGRDRAEMTNPMRSAMDRGIVVTMHNDAPIIGPDPFIPLWTAVNRLSVRNGTLFGGDERISVREGIRALTINGAYQSFDEDRKGSIEPGKLADLIILNLDPLSIKPIDLKEIRVLETIKGGVTVYTA